MAKMNAKLLLSTEDLSKFKPHHLNRDICQKHVRYLTNAIRKENLLHLHPIIVNTDYEIISGQHRLEAARALKVPIYYVIENTSDEHILNANWMQRTSTSVDSVSFFMKKYSDNPDYCYLNNLMKEEYLSLKAALCLISGNHEMIYEDLRTGDFKIKDMKECRELMSDYMMIRDYLKKFDIKPASMWRNATFCRAFRMMHEVGVNWEVFKSKVNTQWTKIRHQPSVKYWLEHLIGIYNYKNSDKIRIEE